MSPKTTPQKEKLYELLTWDWQPVEPIMEEMMRVVPPGMALRRYNSIRERNKANKTTEVSKAELTESEKIRSGARNYCRDAVNSAATYNYLETTKMDGVEYIRRKVKVAPGEVCECCGRLYQGETQDPMQPVSKKSHPTLGKVLRPHFPQWAS